MNHCSSTSSNILSIFPNSKKVVRALSVMLFCVITTPLMAWGAGNTRIELIQVTGLKGLSQEAVLHQLPLQAGDWFDESKSEALIKKLYATQWFKEVKLARKGTRLEIKVVERPIISEISFKGSHGLPQEALDKMLQEFGLVDGEFFSPSTLEKFKKFLLHTYTEGGKYASKVVISVIPEAENIVKIAIEAEPGATLRFASIRLLGVHRFSEKRVLAALPVSTHRFWGFLESKSNYCTRGTKEQTLATLLRFYKNQGYHDIQINTHQLSVTGNRCNADWVIDLTEGPCYKIGQYRILGESYGLSKEKLQSLIEFKSGDQYSQKALLSAQEAIQGYFGEKGYIFSKVHIKPHVDAKARFIHLAIEVAPGEKTYVRRIDFLGSRYIKDSILRRSLVQEEASLASSKEHETSEQHLQQSGFVNQANIDVVPVTGLGDQVDLAVSVEEKQPQGSLKPLGFSSGANGVIWNVELPLTNLLGTGKDFILKMDRDAKQIKGEAGYKSNYTDIFGLQDVRWNFRGHVSNHNANFNFKSITNAFNQSPYVCSIKDQGDFISSLADPIKDSLKSFFSNGKSEERPKNERSASNEKESEAKESETKENIKKYKINRTHYKFDEWGTELGLEVPQSKSNITWQMTGGFKSLDFYFPKKAKEKYAQQVRDFVDKKGEKVNQWIGGLGRYNTTLKARYQHFPTSGSESRVLLNLAFSNIIKSNTINDNKDTSKEQSSTKKPNEPLHYFKLSYSGSTFKTFMPDSRSGGHTLGFRWNLGMGQQFSGKNRALPFFDAYHSDNFYGYESSALGPRDSNGHMLGGSLFLKGQGMYFLPKPFQGDFLKIANAALPYRSSAFWQLGNVYGQETIERFKFNDLSSLSTLHKGFPLALSVGLAFELLFPLPMVGVMPFYVSLSMPLLEGGNKRLQERHAKYFHFGVDFSRS